MLRNLIEYRKPWQWFLFHILLGIISTFSPIPLIVFFYVFFISSVFKINSGNQGSFNLNLLIVYLIPFEILARMTKTSPFIPYELSKYLMFLLLFVGVFKGSRRGKLGYFLLLMLLPALFFDYSGQVDYQGLVFNALAPINLCLGVVYFYKNPVSLTQLNKLIVAMSLPLISALVYAYLKTPDYETIEFNLGANFETTGGFGSNQVSTVFGLGMFLTFYLWFRGISISGVRFVDSAIIFLFSFQGLLSFSRGGMIGGVLAILIFLFFKRNKGEVILGSRSNKSALKLILPGLLLVIVSIWLANTISNGQLLMRYRGETAGTLNGTKDKDINTITSNRASILEGDIDLFTQNPFGVGVGASRYLRNTENGVVSHTEFSRLLAEHGYLGLIFFITISILPLFYFSRSYSGELKGFMVALFFLAWYTSFHAATRNFVTPLLIGLALVKIQPEISKSVKNEIAA